MTQSLQVIFAKASPFVRKVCVVAAETKKSLERIDVFASPLEGRSEVIDLNPLGKIPALRTLSGEVIYDSTVICRYLGDGTTLYPNGDALWRALRREALADGLMDAALLVRYETTMRPEPLRWQEWHEGQMEKVMRALSAMAADVTHTSAFDIGDIATGCALGYLDFRFPDLDWRSTHPDLATYAKPLHARTSFQETIPA
ncbi:MAG: glutathione S-transferase [Hyphomicrobiales bacterium]|nr:glutathione S-transferase family protein [Hyphomicrobiales bacterium]PCH50908.1 MAG: glutathione S-transferase [Hyphomicrobiales bacterium]